MIVDFKFPSHKTYIFFIFNFQFSIFNCSAMHPKISLVLLLGIIFFLPSCKEEKKPIKIDHTIEIPTMPRTLSLFFCGDVIQHLPQIYSAHEPTEKDYNYLKCFRYIAPLWHDSDFVIANLETTLSDKEFSGYPRFSSPWQIARDLQRLGVTTFVTANNHCCDQLAQGITKTIYYLDSLGIAHTGIFMDTLSYMKRNPLYLQKDGFKIALLNYTYGTNGLPIPKGFVVSLIDTTVIKRDIRQAQRDSATNIITFMHWGYEYHTSPNKEQKTLAAWLHAQGADIVIGSHPHVVQPLEYNLMDKDTTGVTVYSLGNFISNQTYQGTDGGICVRLILTQPETGKTRYNMETIKFYTYRPYEEGRLRYYVVPEILADSVVKDYHLAKSKRFFRKTDSILNSSVKF